MTDYLESMSKLDVAVYDYRLVYINSPKKLKIH